MRLVTSESSLNWLIGNRLTRFRTIGHCTKLTCLHAERNSLTTLPKTFGRLVLLKKLYLQNNKLEKLQSSVGKCLKLETINVEDNCLSKIGKKVVNLANLKYFMLANNKLTKLPFNPHSTSRGLRRCVPVLAALRARL